MEHIQLTGTHYEAGFQWGSLLFRRQIILTDHIPFPITRERVDFARACLPVYAAHFPQILEELRGLADGQRCDAEILQAVLFSMYAIPPACGCSCFAAATDKGVLLGATAISSPLWRGTTATSSTACPGEAMPLPAIPPPFSRWRTGSTTAAWPLG